VIDRPIILATRGSALALAQTNTVLAECRSAFPDFQFEIKIIKTTGDKLQTAPPDVPGMAGTKGLFTKELEIALLNGEADLAVHSLKDLPTELPEGLALRAVLPRADVRDVLIYRLADAQAPKRGLKPQAKIHDFPSGAVIATSSTRRQAQLLLSRPDLKVVPIRGNVGTRLQKLADMGELDGIVLASAGLRRLGFQVTPDGRLETDPAKQSGAAAPRGLLAVYLAVEEMLPCVGQGAIGLEGRRDDSRLAPIFERLNHRETWYCVTAERAFLREMGGGCLSPVAAYADNVGGQLRLRAVSFRQEQVRRAEGTAVPGEAEALGCGLAKELA
jgi:hydroxymethylbilane synthase